MPTGSLVVGNAAGYVFTVSPKVVIPVLPGGMFVGQGSFGMNVAGWIRFLGSGPI